MSIAFCNTVGVSSTERGKRRRPDRSFGARLRDARERCGLTQAEVAERLDVSWQTVSNWETGQRTPGADYLLDLAALYGESLVYLLRGVRPRKLDELHEDELWKDLATHVLVLPEERQASVLRAFIALLTRESGGDSTVEGRQ